MILKPSVVRYEMLPPHRERYTWGLHGVIEKMMGWWYEY